MSDLRIEAGAAEAIKGLHEEAAELVEGTGGSAPGSVDAGPADEATAAIMAAVMSEASDLAAVHRGVATVMGDVATDYDATDESVTTEFEQVSQGLPGEGGRVIETKVDGSPSSVRTAATWVDDTLRAAVVDAGEKGTSARRRASLDWEGDASGAYRDVATRVVQAGDEQEEHLQRVAEKFRTYAVKLTNVQQRMADRRSEATAGGLTVAGTVIQTPPEPQRPADLPAGSTQAEADAWERDNAAFERANDKVELYNRLLTEVEDDVERLDQWITANLVNIATADDPSLLSYLVKQLQKLPATALLFTVDLRRGRLDELAQHHRSTAERLRREAAAARRAQRSGNPARRAEGARTDPRANRQAARGLDAVAEGAERVARRLPFVGTALTIGLAGNDIANGDSPGQVISSEVLAAGAGIAVGAVAVAAGAPVLAVAAVGTVAAVGVGMLAEYAWDHWVPEDVTEAIDEGLRDFGEGVADVAGDTWDAITPW